MELTRCLEHSRFGAASFRCGSDYHAPTDCDTIRQWLTKCADDSETANYISAHTKVRQPGTSWMRFRLSNIDCSRMRSAFRSRRHNEERKTWYRIRVRGDGRDWNGIGFGFGPGVSQVPNLYREERRLQPHAVLRLQARLLLDVPRRLEDARLRVLPLLALRGEPQRGQRVVARPRQGGPQEVPALLRAGESTTTTTTPAKSLLSIRPLSSGRTTPRACGWRSRRCSGSASASRPK